MAIYFENLIIELHILCILKIHIKFRADEIMFIILFINLFFMHNFKIQKFKI